jgi:hypothetical protein
MPMAVLASRLVSALQGETTQHTSWKSVTSFQKMKREFQLSRFDSSSRCEIPTRELNRHGEFSRNINWKTTYGAATMSQRRCEKTTAQSAASHGVHKKTQPLNKYGLTTHLANPIPRRTQIDGFPPRTLYSARIDKGCGTRHSATTSATAHVMDVVASH